MDASSKYKVLKQQAVKEKQSWLLLEMFGGSFRVAAKHKENKWRTMLSVKFVRRMFFNIQYLNFFTFSIQVVVKFVR